MPQPARQSVGVVVSELLNQRYSSGTSAQAAASARNRGRRASRITPGSHSISHGAWRKSPRVREKRILPASSTLGHVIPMNAPRCRGGSLEKWPGSMSGPPQAAVWYAARARPGTAAPATSHRSRGHGRTTAAA